jgi:Na+/H+-translocating membrane pyrophosphatase
MHVLVGVVVALVVGGILAYAFRGKEHAAIDAVGAEAKKVVDKVEEKL